eukprot:SAG25_NODE_50_length_18801_cov_117.737729_6_plen_295_part_00
MHAGGETLELGTLDGEVLLEVAVPALATPGTEFVALVSDDAALAELASVQRRSAAAGGGGGGGGGGLHVLRVSAVAAPVSPPVKEGVGQGESLMWGGGHGTQAGVSSHPTPPQPAAAVPPINRRLSMAPPETQLPRARSEHEVPEIVMSAAAAASGGGGGRARPGPVTAAPLRLISQAALSQAGAVASRRRAEAKVSAIVKQQQPPPTPTPQSRHFARSSPNDNRDARALGHGISGGGAAAAVAMGCPVAMADLVGVDGQREEEEEHGRRAAAPPIKRPSDASSRCSCCASRPV